MSKCKMSKKSILVVEKNGSRSHTNTRDGDKGTSDMSDNRSTDNIAVSPDSRIITNRIISPKNCNSTPVDCKCSAIGKLCDQCRNIGGCVIMVGDGENSISNNKEYEINNTTTESISKNIEKICSKEVTDTTGGVLPKDTVNRSVEGIILIGETANFKQDDELNGQNSKDGVEPAHSGEKETKPENEPDTGDVGSKPSILKDSTEILDGGPCHTENNETPHANSSPHVKIVNFKDPCCISSFKPAVLSNPVPTSKILEYRRLNQIVAEGFMHKKRVIFRCFWHQKYFVLLVSGILLYHKCDGSKFAKGNYNIKEMEVKSTKSEGSYYPFRIELFQDGSCVNFFGFYNEEERDYWIAKLRSVK